MITPPVPGEDDMAGSHRPSEGKENAFDIKARLDREEHEEYLRKCEEAGGAPVQRVPMNAPQHDIEHSPSPQVRDQRNF